MKDYVDTELIFQVICFKQTLQLNPTNILSKAKMERVDIDLNATSELLACMKYDNNNNSHTNEYLSNDNGSDIDALDSSIDSNSQTSENGYDSDDNYIEYRKKLDIIQDQQQKKCNKRKSEEEIIIGDVIMNGIDKTLEQSRMEQKLDDIEKTLEDIFSNIPGIEYLRYTNYFDKKKEVIIL
jgi:hypothetical protein